MIAGNCLYMSSHFNSTLKAANTFLEYIMGEYQTKVGEQSCLCSRYC